MDPVTLDALDLRVLHALHLDARAPFSRIAKALDVADRTVARRFGRLRAAGAARVTATVSSRDTGQVEWLVRLRVRPDAAPLLARGLARRPDTRWVTVLSGGTEIGCILRASRAAPPPLEELARHRQILQVDAQRLLRHLMDRQWSGRTSALTADQIAALRPPAGDGHRIVLNDLDRRLLPALATDGRAAYPELARRVGWSESAIRRRLEELRRSNTLHLDVEVDPLLLGYSAQCLLRLAIAPSRLSSAARSLAAHPETAFVGATTGKHNLIAIAVCRDDNALYAHLSDRIGSLDGVERLETAPITSYTKRHAPTL
ncbi:MULTISPECIES: Lrp/AsnC family transcriptional regulator [Actinomadura]|uniref:Lrp/AsnC family transcriptional regulator n=1 Tax=Actinomadura yumaensis TaxID=111807 RepID=A0ABW2CKC7_9ACTN|nr:Lrp/AsnC family transcriptional regulator [Actinomadura sp. J1-007]MWK38581.1 AsnC family transcriptional regulator [Actinomadura sp. J1-007]